MNCSLHLPPQMLSLSPSTPHPLSKKSDINQARKKSILDTSLSSHGAGGTTEHKCAVISSIPG